MSYRPKRQNEDLKNIQASTNMMNYKPLSKYRANYRASNHKNTRKNLNITNHEDQSKWL